MSVSYPSTESAPTLIPENPRPSGAVEVSRRPTPIQRIRHLWRYRELIGNLTRKELKVKYKNSVLGFLWSLINPLTYLVVFSLVFSVISKVPVPYFGIFFISGLLAWNLFSSGLMEGTGAIVANAGLVTKVWFPREALILASIFAAIVHFFLQAFVLMLALAVFRYSPAWSMLPLLVLALVTLIVFVTALAIILGAVNVYLRDTGHLVEAALLAWFWMSAIAFTYGQVAAKIVDRWGTAAEWITALNPVLSVVVTFQRVVYDPPPPTPEQLLRPDLMILPPHPVSWYVTRLSITLGVSLVLLYAALALFSRLEDDFAQEL